MARLQKTHPMKHLTKQFVTALVFAIACGAFTYGDTIDFAGSVAGTFTVDNTGPCAPSPTVVSAGIGEGTLLGSFVAAQSHCMTSDTTFDQGVFDFTSVANPGDSLSGSYFAVASSQDGLLDFTSILLVEGGTGLFAEGVGAIFGTGTLDETTGTWNETLSGQVDATTPEPREIGLITLGLAALLVAKRFRSPRQSFGASRKDPLSGRWTSHL